MDKFVRHGGKLTLLAACSILAACGGGGGGDASGGLTQSITLSYPGGATLLAGPVTLKATTTSGLPVTYKSNTPSACTVSGDQLTLVAAGECSITASQPGGTTEDGRRWAAADDMSQLFNVLKHAQLPITPLGVMVRGSSGKAELSATTDVGIAASYTSTTPEVCTVSGTTLTALKGGLCLLGVTAPANDSYAALVGASALIQVGPLPPTVVQRQGKTQTIALASVDEAGNAVTYASTAPAVCSVSGTTLQLNADGLCTVTMSGAGGASENLAVNVGPRFFASGFNMSTGRTTELGEIVANGGFPEASWCGAVTPSYCNLTVNPLFAAFSYDIKPAALSSAWNPNFAWSYYTFEISAPSKQNGSNFELLPFDIKTEESLFVTLNVNSTLLDDTGKGSVFVRIKTNHLIKKSDGSDCYVTVAAHLRTSAAPTGFSVPFKDFAVTDKCESADVPQTEGWMFDWGVTTESKTAALKEIKTYGIRALQFAPKDGLNSKKPTPNADGSTPTDPKNSAYTLTTGIMVWGPITVQ